MMRRTARTTIAHAVTGITYQGKPVTVSDGVPRPGDAPSPSIVVVYTGATDTDLTINVELYVRGSDVGAQDVLLDVATKIDEKLAGAGFGPPGEQVTYASDLDAWVCVFPVMYPRTDLF